VRSGNGYGVLVVTRYDDGDDVRRLEEHVFDAREEEGDSVVSCAP
jgi:hypothetical protein